jgi:hypothetical protein
MTHGPVPAASITEALNAYNSASASHYPVLIPVTMDELMGWAEIHHILTARYATGGRYTYLWNQTRPS